MHICHLEGFRQKSCFAGVHDGGGVSGSWKSVGRPISERLQLIVRRLVMSTAVLCSKEGLQGRIYDSE
jgi:hypothetical protein